MSEDGIARDGLKPGDLVVITGAGGGFGRAFALRFAKLGARLSLWDIDVASGEAVAAEARELGADVQFVPVDLAERDAIASAVQGYTGGDGHALLYHQQRQCVPAW